MKSVGLVLNMKKPYAIRMAEQIVTWFNKREITVRIPRGEAIECGLRDLACSDDWFLENLDCIIALGGDGTLLSTARAASQTGIPILGINLGHLGFLTEIELPDLYPSLEKLVTGEYRVEERLMLEALVNRAGKVAASFRGLNDAVVTKGPLSRIIKLDTFVGEEYIGTFPADGLIVSTPTGSTAYSLSAGGPIVTPALQVILLTPICPHSLTSRPLVVSSEQTVRIVLMSDLSEVMLTIDGQDGFLLEKNDQIVVRKAENPARLIRLKGRSFFEVLREKLREGAGNNV